MTPFLQLCRKSLPFKYEESSLVSHDPPFPSLLVVLKQLQHGASAIVSPALHELTPGIAKIIDPLPGSAEVVGPASDKDEAPPMLCQGHPLTVTLL